MLRHGPSLFPTTYGELYPDYPATATFFIYWLALLFGGISKFTAVLPTALAAAITLALSYRLLAPVSRTWALLAVCMQLLTATFVAEARSISLDQMIAAITIGSFFCAYSADSENNPSRRYWLPALLIVGFAIRGPLGLVLPAGVVCSYYLLSKQWRSLLWYGATAALLLAICWTALLGLARHAGGDVFMRDVIRMQVAGRLDAHGGASPFYYFTSSFGNYALAFPLAVFVVLGTLSQWRRRLSTPPAHLLLFFIGWALLIIAGLSIPHTKKIRYLLPMMPAIAAIATYPFIDQSTGLLRWLRKIMAGIFLLFPMLAGIALWAANNFAQKHQMALPFSFSALIVTLLGIQLIVISCAIRFRDASTRTSITAICAAGTLWVVQVFLIEPAQLQLHDTQIFVRAVEHLREQQPAPLAFFDIGKDAAAIKYMVNIDYDLRPTFYATADEVNRATPPFYLVLDKDHQAALNDSRVGKLLPAFEGRFDNDTYAVFYVTEPY